MSSIRHVFISVYRSNAVQQTSLDKFKKAADDAKHKSEFLESQLSSHKKVRDLISVYLRSYLSLLERL